MKKLLWAVTVLSVAQANIVINEIADKGTSDVCSGRDWIELYNAGSKPVYLGADNYVLHDDKGLRSEDAFVFPPDTVLDARDYLLLCTNQELPTDVDGVVMADPTSPQFGISGDDAISLVRIHTIGNATLETNTILSAARTGMTYEVVSFVSLPNTDDDFDVSYAFDFSTGLYNYTSTPTPGAVNVISELLTQEEKNALLKAKLNAQNELGTKFFNMDNQGLPIAEGMDDVLDLSLTMTEPDYAYLVENKTFELYRPFQSAVLAKTDGTEVATMTLPGRIRAKGQSSLYLATCMDADAFPLQIEPAEEELFFGMERFYLRHHVGDYSYMRDWAYNRMLARFGLPFIRVRKTRLYINGNYHGLYSLMEAPDQGLYFCLIAVN